MSEEINWTLAGDAKAIFQRSDTSFDDFHDFLEAREIWDMVRWGGDGLIGLEYWSWADWAILVGGMLVTYLVLAFVEGSPRK